MKFYRKVLGNGLTIIEVPSNDAESVVVDFFVQTGSRSETPKENGISHFLEHFLFKGTEKYPTTLAITELVDSIGAEMNANTGKEHTQYYIKAKSSYLPLIFEVLTDMLLHPLLDAVELEREKGVIVEEINMYKDIPMAEIENLLEATMWPKQSLGRDIAGTKDTVTKFTRAMFQKYLDAHYQTPNIIIGVSGKYDRKHLHELIRKYWAKLPSRRFHSFDKAKSSQSKPRIALQYKVTEQAHLQLGFKGFKFGDKRNTAATVLSTILGSGMSSRLFIEVREKRGLAYYVRAGAGSYQDTGAFTIGAGLQVDKVEEALKVILHELKNIQDFVVDEKELHKAKEYIKGKTTLALEDNQTRLDWYLEQEAFHPDLKTPQQFFDKVDAVTSKDVQKVAKELFNINKSTLAIIGPYKSDKNFLKILQNN
jgi:predicted Zn-dependent peptidase